MEDITGQFNAVNARQISPEKLAAERRQRSVRFKASLTVLGAFFLYLTLLHGLGIFFFTKGFLLTRLVLDEKSSCAQPPIEVSTQAEGCWHPQTFDKAVILIIDALRYDFTVPRPGSNHHFHNALRVLHETASDDPQKAFLRPFIADPPTTTLQRLKGLTTGTLPTFVDAGSNFAGTAIEEDNLLDQLRAANYKLVHLGDDTWHSLFPNYFEPNLTHPYDSFNVWDLYTVDNGVTQHLLPLLAGETGKASQDWDIIFGHFLGVDHAGHRYGPDHPATHSKLEEMDGVIRRTIDLLDDDTLLVVMGDHGMDVKGDHGGESDDEVEAALWMYSKKSIFGRGHDGNKQPPLTAKERPVGQIDLVPTLALLLGIPIPFNNLGAPIPEAFVGPNTKPDWRNLAAVYALAASQVARYQQAYSSARGLEAAVFQSAQSALHDGIQYWTSARSSAQSSGFENAYKSLAVYQTENLRICRSLWARFDVPSMLQGVLILAVSLFILLVFARSMSLAGPASASTYLARMSVAGGICSVGAVVAGFILVGSVDLVTALQGLAAGSLLGFLAAFVRLPWARMSGFSIIPSSIWGWLAFVVTVSQSIGFASNSYTIWEDNILVFFLVTFAILGLAASARLADRESRVLGTSQSIFFAVLTLIASYSRLCREEQMPFCRSTYYASSASSTSAPWQLIIPFLTAIVLPLVIKTYYQRTQSYDGVASLWVGLLLRIGLLAVAVYWLSDATESHAWLPLDESILQTIKITLARIILGVSLVVGTSSWVFSRPCVSIRIAEHEPNGTTEPTERKDPKQVLIYGASNAHGARYYLLLTTLLVALSLVQKPMGNGALAILAIQILVLLEIVRVNNLPRSAIGPVILACLGNYHFFKTGHQTTLSSIQWDAAFIPLSTIVYPFSPLLVVANTCGAQILTALAAPLFALWRQPAKKPSLLGDVAIALGTFLLYHATINLATTMWAGHLRRHLMLFRIFSPRFMTAAAVLLIVDLVAVLGGMGAVWCNAGSVAEIFGWA